MSLTLYYHPLSSYCHKVLIALYENAVSFTPRVVNLGDPAERAMLRAMWPIGKFPVLGDAAAGIDVVESSVIIEYLDQRYRGATRFIPDDAALALEVRTWDRIVDLHVHAPLQKIVGDRLRPENLRDATGVAEARATLLTAYAMIERRMSGRTWLGSDAFTLADCAAAPPLFYASAIVPFPAGHGNLVAYFDRLVGRPSYARVLEEAKPFFQYFPFAEGVAEKFKR